MRVGIPQKGSSKASTAFHQCPILPKVEELMVNNQQYDSHEGRPPIVARVFHSWSFPPHLRSAGLKVQSGKEDTTLLSMVDCRVKKANVSIAHQIWNKTPDSRVSKGERTHRGSKDPSTKKKLMNHITFGSAIFVSKIPLHLGPATIYALYSRLVKKNGILCCFECDDPDRFFHENPILYTNLTTLRCLNTHLRAIFAIIGVIEISRNIVVFCHFSTK